MSDTEGAYDTAEAVVNFRAVRVAKEPTAFEEEARRSAADLRKAVMDAAAAAGFKIAAPAHKKDWANAVPLAIFWPASEPKGEYVSLTARDAGAGLRVALHRPDADGVDTGDVHIDAPLDYSVPERRWIEREPAGGFQPTRPRRTAVAVVTELVLAYLSEIF